MAKVYYERHSLAIALQESLTNTGWNIGEVRKGFQDERDISTPMVSVHFLPSKYMELQLGQSISSDKIFERRVQIDAYMETEPRAMSIGDDIGGFLDSMFITIVDPSGDAIGNLYVPDSETILIETISPRAREPMVNRWRGVVQATLQADYFV